MLETPGRTRLIFPRMVDTPRPFTRTATIRNRAFLAALARSGNSRAAAREAGVNRATMMKRRASHPAFAAEWDGALALAHAALRTPPSAESTPLAQPHVTRLKSGRLQLRARPPGKLTTEIAHAFLAALSATANVRLSAKAAGLSHAAFYHRARTDPAFAREMRLALQMGYERIETALLESTSVDGHRYDEWRHNDPPPIPPMTVNQALQLMYLHQKEARLIVEPAHVKRRRGESSDVYSTRIAAMYEEGQRRAREAFDLAEAARRARGEPYLMGPKHLPARPALDQVTGWSKADPAKTPIDEGRALFGGWRLGDWKG